LVGGNGGGGGTLVLFAILKLLLYPSWQESVWGLNLFLEFIGAILIGMAIFVQEKIF
jgi:hypothetical protein